MRRDPRFSESPYHTKTASLFLRLPHDQQFRCALSGGYTRTGLSDFFRFKRDSIHFAGSHKEKQHMIPSTAKLSMCCFFIKHPIFLCLKTVSYPHLCKDKFRFRRIFFYLSSECRHKHSECPCFHSLAVSPYLS